MTLSQPSRQLGITGPEKVVSMTHFFVKFRLAQIVPHLLSPEQKLQVAYFISAGRLPW